MPTDIDDNKMCYVKCTFRRGMYYNLLKKSQLKHMYYIKIPTVRFTGLVRPDPQGELLIEGLNNLDGIRQNELSGHLMMDGGELRG